MDRVTAVAQRPDRVVAAPRAPRAHGRRDAAWSMAVAIGGRLLHIVVVLFVVSLLTFVLFNSLPGDAAGQLLGPQATPDQLADLRRAMKLDQPLVSRYLSWMGDVVRGDLGESITDGTDVWDQIARRLPVSLEIMAAAQIVSLALAIPVGIILARRPGSKTDRAGSGIVIGMMTIPNFIVGFLLIFLFALKLGWFPATGFKRLSEDGVWANLKTMVLPVATIAIGEVAVYARTLRADLVQTLQQDYVDVAIAKGIPERRVLLFHALRPSSLSLVTLAGLNIARLVGGAVIVEALFAIPGIGQMLVLAIGRRDITALQGVVLVVAVAYVVINALVDVLYRILDPRIRRGAG